MIDLTKYGLKPIYKNNVLDHYGLVPKAEPAISVDIEPKQPAICVNQSLSMTSTDTNQAKGEIYGRCGRIDTCSEES